MGPVTNNSSERLEVLALRRELDPGETVDVDDAVLSAHMFAWPVFLVNGQKRVGPFEDVTDFSDPKYLATEDPSTPAPVPPAAPEVTE
jgi:hypothetical protein